MFKRLNYMNSEHWGPTSDGYLDADHLSKKGSVLANWFPTFCHTLELEMGKNKCFYLPRGVWKYLLFTPLNSPRWTEECWTYAQAAVRGREWGDTNRNIGGRVSAYLVMRLLQFPSGVTLGLVDSCTADKFSKQPQFFFISSLAAITWPR